MLAVPRRALVMNELQHCARWAICEPPRVFPCSGGTDGRAPLGSSGAHLVEGA